MHTPKSLIFTLHQNKRGVFSKEYDKREREREMEAPSDSVKPSVVDHTHTHRVPAPLLFITSATAIHAASLPQHVVQ